MADGGRNWMPLAALLAAARVAGAGLGFLTYLALARLMGAGELGEVFSAMSLAAIGGTLVTLGFPQIATRFFARYRGRNRPRFTALFVAEASRRTIAAAVLAGMLLAAPMWLGLLPPGTAALIACAAILPVAVMNLYSGFANANRDFAAGYVPEGLVRPLLLLLLLALIHGAGWRLTPATILSAFTLSTALVALWLILRLRNISHAPRRPPRRLRRLWRREAYPLVAMVIFTEFFADIGILAATPYLEAGQMAVFGLCLKLALLTGYAVQVSQQIAAPGLADSRNAHDPGALRREARWAVLLPSLLTLAVLAGVAVVGRPFLGLFGEDFAAGYQALVILTATQIVRALAGPSTQILVLRGSQGLNAALSLAAIVALAILNAVLIPRFGINGAAIAVFLTYGLWLAAQSAALRLLNESRVDALALLPSRNGG